MMGRRKCLQRSQSNARRNMPTGILKSVQKQIRNIPMVGNQHLLGDVFTAVSSIYLPHYASESDTHMSYTVSTCVNAHAHTHTHTLLPFMVKNGKINTAANLIFSLPLIPNSSAELLLKTLFQKSDHQLERKILFCCQVEHFVSYFESKVKQKVNYYDCFSKAFFFSDSF